MVMTDAPSRRRARAWPLVAAALLAAFALAPIAAQEQRDTIKPTLHGKHWVAIAGKPLGAAAGAKIFERGGNAVDAACGMLAALATMWDTLSWGGETQALIYDPRVGKVRAINALGMAPTGATPEFFRSRGMRGPPELGPLAALTPGTPGGLMVMLAEFGTMSLAQVLQPAMEMAAGYPMEQTEAINIESSKELLLRWESSRRVLLPNLDPQHPQHWAAPRPGQIFEQPELLATLTKLVETERKALASGKNRKQAIAIALNEAGNSKFKSDAKNRQSETKTQRKEARGETAQQEKEGKGHVGAEGKRESSRAMGGKDAAHRTAAGKRAANARVRGGKTKDELYKQAQRRNIPNRSKLTKTQLENALH